MMDLCNEFKINVNELLCGERISTNNYSDIVESNLLDMTRKDEMNDKKIMTSVWVIFITSVIFYIELLVLAINILEEGLILGIAVCVSTITFLIANLIALKIEIDVGYYECKNYHHKFVPSFKDVFISTHMGTTRHLRCPECHKKTWG